MRQHDQGSPESGLMSTPLEDLITKLESIERDYGDDPERSHQEADRALLAFIQDERVRRLHVKLAPWCA